MAIQLAVFDIAGTTVQDDDYVARAFTQAFVKNGYSISLKQTYPYMGVKKIVAVKTMLSLLKDTVNDDEAEKIHADFVNEMMNFYEYDPAVKPLPFAEQTFEQLKEKGILIALNTGFPRCIADTIVSRLQWKEKGLIDDYIASDEVELGRPSPMMIEELMKRAGVTDAAAVAKIGDTEVDINEGRNSGCGIVVSVTTGAYTKEQLAAYTPDHILDDLSALPAIIFDCD
jgi:phosphonatase-like hydrolase